MASSGLPDGYEHDGVAEGNGWPSAEYAADLRSHLRGRTGEVSLCGASAEAQELHVCMGLSACKGLDADGKAYMAGTGSCATVRHVCHGEGHCRGQGGCGYAGGDYEQFIPGAQACRFNGSCASPINVSRVFSAGPMKGKSVWKQARRIFEERMYEAKLAFGPPRGEGIPDDLLPRYDVIDESKIPPRPDELKSVREDRS
ncbi:hypothetical protein [Saccharopolyspora sp. 5N708]|uniref:hypothetical protein n=1 Tax=Saccharopolyspora sp. 5N708 TaxID=3457424 RepID=UPI003FD2DE7D